jgi:hypothetical protein
MKATIPIVALIALLGIATGCKPASRVTFKPALVSIDPGGGWMCMNVSAKPPVCSPRLVSKAGMINALLLEDFTDTKKAADFLQSRFATGSKVVAESFKQEDFTTDGGLSGIHLSYTAASKDSTTPDERSHSFITRNRRGQCVSISFITSPTAESATVLQAISKSIRVE